MVVFLLHSSGVSAQWRITSSDNSSKSFENKKYPTKLIAIQAVQNHYSQLLADGYLDAQIDTVVKDSTVYLSIVTGNQYSVTNLQWSYDSLPVLFTPPAMGGRHKDKSLTWVANQMKSMLSYCENNGYPFAGITPTSLTAAGNQIAMTLSLKPGPYIVLDSLALRSDDRLPAKYIRHYLDFRPGQPYNESRLRSFDKKIKEIPFLTATAPTEIAFTPGKADVYLFLQRKKASFFNGIIGIRPDDQSGRIHITGDAEVKLVNAFHSGEEFYINWRKLQPQTQDLAVKIHLPYLLSTPIGLDCSLKLYKRDSSYTSTILHGGLVFAFGGTNYLKAFIERNITNQLATYFSSLPIRNIHATLYGLSTRWEQLDYRLNPRKGYRFEIQLATGVRQLSPQQVQTTEPKTTERYSLYKGDWDNEFYIPTFRKQTIRLGFMGGSMISKQMYDNELYRIGGVRTLRGIDEESIYAGTWGVANVEYRFLLEENGAIYAFYDQGWYEKKGVTQYTHDTPSGFGLGINLEVGTGVFTFNYALGQQFDNPIRLRNAKISFGFRSVF